jgi:1,4-alpha-glucan branching enzyme
MAKIGYFTFVLHGHLPYVLNHGQWPHGMDWLSEAALYSYIPLLREFYRLKKEGVDFHLTIDITPVLAEQLSHPLFMDEFKRFLQSRMDTAQEDKAYFKKTGQDHMAGLAQFWEDYFTETIHFYHDEIREDILAGFRELQEDGYLEIMTCAATHGYLPLLGLEKSINLQLSQGKATYERHFGRPPRGIWLPECAYRPRYRWEPPFSTPLYKTPMERSGIEEHLAAHELRFFVVDTHLLAGGKAIGTYVERFPMLRRLWLQSQQGQEPLLPPGKRSPYQSYCVSSTGDLSKAASFFTRDPHTALQVWSAEHGYPGDYWYLEFHKKHFPGGLRYWRITKSKSDLAEKEPYVPERAHERLRAHAEHFVGLIREQLDKYHNEIGEQGVVCAPYDMELFGHWWFEGPEWLALVLRHLAEDKATATTTCNQYLEANPPSLVMQLPEGSWGEGGYHFIWLNEDTLWTWEHIYEMEHALRGLKEVKKRLPNDATLQELICQSLRELLLLQSSDWQFLISTVSARDYAELRFSTHYEWLRQLISITREYLKTGYLSDEDRNFLSDCRQRDDLFPELDWRWFYGYNSKKT